MDRNGFEDETRWENFCGKNVQCEHQQRRRREKFAHIVRMCRRRRANKIGNGIAFKKVELYGIVHRHDRTFVVSCGE